MASAGTKSFVGRWIGGAGVSPIRFVIAKTMHATGGAITVAGRGAHEYMKVGSDRGPELRSGKGV